MNYKVGWVIPGQVIGLTHYIPTVTLADVEGVIATTTQLLSTVHRPFHMIIDNRVVSMKQLPDLQDLQSSSPFINHDLLREVVMVVPFEMSERPAPQHAGNVTLSYTDTIEAAIHHLDEADDLLDVADMDARFFPEHT